MCVETGSVCEVLRLCSEQSRAELPFHPDGTDLKVRLIKDKACGAGRTGVSFPAREGQ